MKTMKRLLALLLALCMVMPNCLTIASAYTEEYVEELAEEVFEEEFVEEFVEEELYEEELHEEVIEEEVIEEELYEEVAEEILVEEEYQEYNVSDDVGYSAVESETVSLGSYGIPDAVDDSEEQFAAFANTILYPDRPALLGTDGRDALSGSNLEIYDAIAPMLQEIAGSTVATSTVITIGYGTEILPDLFMETGNDLNLNLLIDALLADMPYALYWYDKVSGVSATLGTAKSGDEIFGYQLTLAFTVASAYSVSGEAETYETSGAKAAAAVNAAEYAAQVAQEQCKGSDYETLQAYGQWIMNALDYNHTAAEGGGNYFSTVNSDPWQLIYVFDKDSTTNTVCEGYSKAFQYLCDLAYAAGDMDAICYSVTGDLYDVNDDSLGGHMWNTVLIGENRYLVDLTNCDTGWKAFLVGATGEEVTRTETYINGETGESYDVQGPTMHYHIVDSQGNDGLGFEYDLETVDLYTMDDLLLSEADYDPNADVSGDSGETGDSGEDWGDGTGSEGGEEIIPPTEFESASDLQAALDASEFSVELAGDVTVNQGETLRISEGKMLYLGGKLTVYGMLEVEGGLEIMGTLENHGNVLVVQNSNVSTSDGTIDNYGAIQIPSAGATLDVSNGTYTASGSASVNVRFFDEGQMGIVSGIDESLQTLFYNGSDASMLKTLPQYCGYGNPANVKGNYGGYKVNVEGTMTITEYTDIYAKGSLGFAPNATLEIANGAMLYNMGTVYVRDGATVIVNERAELQNFRNFDTAAGSVINNYGVIGNNGNAGSDSFGYMNLIGTFNQYGKLYLNATGTQWGNILGVDPSLVTLSSTIGADWSDETALATLKAAKDSGYGLTQIWLEGEHTFDEHLALVTPVELHICGDVELNGGVTLGVEGKTTAELIVEEGATLTVNKNAEDSVSMMVFNSSAITVNGTLNSNAWLHLGYDGTAAQLNVNGVMNNNHYLNIGSGAEVTIAGTLNHNAYDESTGLGGVIVENHGTITVAEDGVFNGCFDVVNNKTIVNNGTFYLPAVSLAGNESSLGGEGSWEGNDPIYVNNEEEPEEPDVPTYTAESLQEALNAASEGDVVTLSNDLEISAAGLGLTVPAGVTLEVVDATLIIATGTTVINRGVFTLSEGAVLVNNGSLTNFGTEMNILGDYSQSTGEFLVGTDSENVPGTINGLNSSEITISASISMGDALTQMMDRAPSYKSITIVTGGVIEGELYIPENVRLMVMNGTTLTIAADAVVSNYGNITIRNGVMEVEGTLNNYGTVNNVGTVNYSGTISNEEESSWLGSLPVYVGSDGYTAESLQEALSVAEENDVIVLSNHLELKEMVLTIPAGVTLQVAEGATLYNTSAQINVFGTLEVAGDLVNNSGIFMASDDASLDATGTVTNAGQISTESTGAVMSFANYIEEDGGRVMATYGQEDNVTGLSSEQVYLCAYADGDVDYINAVQSAVSEGGYAGASISITNHMAVGEGVELTIDATTTLVIKYDCTIENNGEIVNNGTFVLSMRGDSEAGAQLINNDLFVNNGTFMATGLSTVDNHGIIENRADGSMTISGTYNHIYEDHAELKIYTRPDPDGLQINDVEGVENHFKTIVTETDDLACLFAGMDFRHDFGQAQVHLSGEHTIEDGLYIPGNGDLHVYGDLTVEGAITMEGGQLQVESGGTLTTNDALWIMQGAYVNVHNTYDAEVVADGILIANAPIHIGFETEPGDGATGVLDVCGVLYTNDYVNICEGAHLNVYGTMNQENVIIENHGLLNIEGGVLNQGWEIYNEGEMTVTGGLNTNSCLWVQKGGILTIGEDAALSFNGDDASINIWEDGTIRNSDDLSSYGTVFNILPWEATEVTGVPAENIYATYFVNSEEELTRAISEAQSNGYGFAEFMPRESFRINGHVTIPAGTIMQLWEHGKPINVTVSNQASLTTEAHETNPGGIIVNPGTRLNVEQGGVLQNDGWVNVTNANNDNYRLTPGILWYYDNDPNDWECLEGNDINTDDGGILSKGTMTEAELEDVLCNGWVHEAYTVVEDNLVIDKPFYLEDYGTIIVPDGKTLTIDAYTTLIGGNIIVEAGGYLQNNSTLEILEGSVYIADGGDASDGDYRGYLTWENGEGSSGTDSYISTYWVHGSDEGTFVNHDYQENRDSRMTPGQCFQWIFYYNEWDSLNRTWSRMPVHPDALELGDNLKLTPGKDIDWIADVRPDYEDLLDYFVEIEVTGGWETDTYVRYHYSEDSFADFNIYIGRDTEHGFYSSTEASNETWLNHYEINPLTGAAELYYIYTDPNLTITGAELSRGGDIATIEATDDARVWKITLNSDVVANIWQNHETDTDIEVKATVTDGENTWDANCGTWGEIWWPHEHNTDLILSMDAAGEGMFEYRYFDGLGWTRSTENGAEVVDMAALGFSYAIETNTLTLEGIDIKGLHLYGGEGTRLTLKLVGENNITTGMEALKVMENMVLTIEGDGVLNLNGTYGSSIDVDPSSKLNLNGGTINVNASLMFGGVVTIDGATVNTFGHVNVDNRLDLLSGELNVTALGHEDWHNERPGVRHTHYDGINVAWGKLLRVAGGDLKITIPEASTESVWFRGINVNAGNLIVNGGTITIDAPANTYGNGIHLDGVYNENGEHIEGTKSTFVMNGGKLVMQEAIFPDYGMVNAIWGNGDAEVEINGGEMDLDAVIIELNGKTTWNDGVVNGEETLILAGGSEFAINGGKFNLTGAPIPGDDEIFSNALFRAHGNVTMNGGTMNIVNGILGVITAFELNGGEITINNTEDEFQGLRIVDYMLVKGGTLNVTVPGGQWTDPETNETVVFPAVWVDGTFHQTGGTVNFTSDTTAAIRSEGTVLLNNGTMNLKGLYGIGQLYNEANPDGMFEVSGGKLNIEATDTGIFTSNSSVRFVKGESSDPTVTIVTIGENTAAIQICSDEEDSGYINEYTFYNADGNELIMDSVDRHGEEYVDCWVHTLMDGDAYATYAHMETIETIANQVALEALVGTGEEPCTTSKNIRITGSVTLPRTVILQGLATLTVESGAVLTIPADFDLAAERGTTILVKDGGMIDNYGGLAANMGTITVENADTGYVHNDNAEVIWHHDYGQHGTITGIDTHCWWVNAVAGNAEQINVINEMADSGDYAAVTIQFFNDIHLTGPVQEIPYEIRVSVNAPWYVYNDLTLDPGIVLNIEEGADLKLWGTDFQIGGMVTNYGKLDLGRGTVTVAESGILANHGELNADGATIGVRGRMINNADLYVTDGAVLTVDGTMMNTGTFFMGVLYPDNAEAAGCQLNINGTFDNYGVMRNAMLGTTNIYGTLNNGFNEQLNKSGTLQNVKDMTVHEGGVLNIGANGMWNIGTLLVYGMMNIRAEVTVENNGFIGLQTTENGGGSAKVTRGGGLNLEGNGYVHIQPNAVLTNGEFDEDGYFVDGSQGDVRIRLGTLYVMEDGEIRGPWDGDITREGHTDAEDSESTASHLSFFWLEDNGEGWYMNARNGSNRHMRMIPGDERWVVFYENLWQEEEGKWLRNPVVVTSDNNEYLTLEYLDDMEDIQIAEDESGYGFLRIRAGDTWNVTANVIANGFSIPIHIGRDLEHGYYTAPEATNENWLETIEVDTITGNAGDKTVYFLLTDDNWVMDGEHWLDLPEGVHVDTAYMNDGTTIRVTIPAETINAMTDGFWMNMNYMVRPADGEGDEEHWEFGIDVRGTDLNDISRDVWMQIDDRDYGYSAEYDLWTVNTEDGRQPIDLNAELGLSYDYKTNTLTMENAKLGSLEVGYYGWDENGRNDSWHDLPNANLTINLVGENSIVSYTDSALRAYRGVKLEITGDGKLYLAAHHGEDGFHNEDYTEFWDGSAIGIGNEESSLTISGNAEVIAEVSGRAYYMEDGVKMDGNIRTIGGHYGSSTLTVKDNAKLTTIVPEGAVHHNNADPADGYTGGYRGIADFVEITVQDNAVLTTQDLDIGTGYYNQTGGNVTINALGYIDFHQEQEGVVHTHFNGIRAEGDEDGGYITISGGKLNINIPEPVTESAWYSAIGMDGGILDISGTAEVTIDGNSTGTGIELNHAAMTLADEAVLNFPEEPFTWMTEDGRPALNRTGAIRSDGDSHVNMLGGTINATGVAFEFNGTSPTEYAPEIETNGKTEWNGTVLNGRMVYFGAGGNAFTMNGGHIELTGEQYSETHFINSIFDAYGMVEINEGATIVLNNGVMGVGAGTDLNGGSIIINNTYDQMEGLYVQNYFAINDGELSVTTPGGSYVNQMGDTESIPAAWIDGTFHQMGGTVNITSDTTAAIKSFGSVLLNNGTMSLSGFRAVEQLYSEDNPDGMFFVNGGELNIDAVDTGIFASNSSVRIVPTEDESGNVTALPAVTIRTTGENSGAIQICSDEEDSKYINPFSFINADGKKLALETVDRRGEEGVDCFVHTLMDGENYATYAQLKPVLRITQDAFEAAMQAAIDAGEQEYVLLSDVTIETSLELPIRVIVAKNGYLTIADGAELTISMEKNLVADGGTITVAEGGKIINDAAQLENKHGTITIAEGGYEEVNDGRMVMRAINTSNGLAIGTTTGWAYEDQVLIVTCENIDQISWAIGKTNELGFGETNIEIWNSITLNTALTIPENVSVSFNSPYMVDGEENDGSVASTLTVNAGGILTMDPASTEEATPGSLFINNGAVLDVQSGGIVNNNGNLHIGDWQNGNFADSGILYVQSGAVVNLKGYTCIHNFNKGSEELPYFVPGMMMVMGTVNSFNEGKGGYIQNVGNLYIQPGGVVNSRFLFSADGQTTVFPGGTLNNYHTMNVTGDVYVEGTLENNGGILLVEDKATFITAGGTVTNNSVISTEGTKSTIDFQNGTYIHGGMTIDGEYYPAELDVDYFADGTTANVKLSNMSEATLRYVGDDFDAAKAMMAKAEADGYGNYILAVDGDMQMSIATDDFLIIDENSYLIVKPGSTLTLYGTLINLGNMYLAAAEEEAANLVNYGWIVNEGTFQAVSESDLNNSGTMENCVGATMKLNGYYGHYGRMLVDMDPQGNTGSLTGNIEEYQKTLRAIIHESVEDREGFLRMLISEASNYGDAEIYLHTDVTVTEELQIPDSISLYVGSEDASMSGSLTLAEGVQLTNKGLLRIYAGELTINGRYIAAGTLEANAGTVTVNGSLVNGNYMDFWPSSKLINNGVIENGNFNLNFQSGATYIHGENASLTTAYIDTGIVITENKIEGIDAGYQTLFHPVRENYADHNEDTIHDMIAAVESGGYAGGEIWIFDKYISIKKDLTIPETVTLRVGMNNMPVELEIAADAKLIVDGTMTIEKGNHTVFNKGITTVNGKLLNNGCFTNECQLDINGNVENYGSVYNEVTTHVYTGGTLYSEGIWEGYAPMKMGGTVSGETFRLTQAKLEKAMAAAAANGIAFKLTESFTLEQDLDVNCDFTLAEGVELTVPAKVTMTILSGNQMTVNGKLINNGTVVIEKNADIMAASDEMVENNGFVDIPEVTVKIANDAATGKPELTWNAVPTAKEYIVRRSATKTGSGSVMATTENTSYINTSAEAGKTYYYHVIAVSRFGSNSGKSNVVSSLCDLAQPKITLSNVASSGKIKVSWKSIDGAVKYEVRRATSKTGTYSLLKTTTSTSYTDTGATAGKTYYYKVRAIAKNTSANSAYAVDSLTCRLARPVVTATNIASSGKVKLSWSAITYVTNYEIWRSTSENGEYTQVGTTTSVTWTDGTAEAGTKYYYRVKAAAKNDIADSALSTVDAISCDLAQPVITLSNAASSGKIKISWKAITNAAKYEVYRATSKTGTYSKRATVTSISYTDTGAVAGKTYYYKVRAIAENTDANSAYSSVKSRICDLAQPVISLSNVSSTGKIKISWKAVDKAVKYEIHRATSEDGTYSLLKTTTSTSYTNTGTTAGKTYYYKVRAIAESSSANSVYSAVDSLTCRLARPDVTAANDASGKVKLSWKKISYASSYEIWRKTSEDSEYTLVDTTTSVTWTDENAEMGIKYSYRVKAAARNDVADSALSNVDYGTRTLAQPSITLSNVASTGKNKVSWKAVTDAVKYEVYRATSKTGTYYRRATITTTSYTDTSAVAGKTYYYKVRAIAENTNANSAYSSVKSRICDLPYPVISLSNVSSSGKIKVSWKAISGASQYKVYRATSEKGSYSLKKTTTSTSWIDTTAAAGTTYYYKVVAVAKTTSANSTYSEIRNRVCKPGRPTVTISNLTTTGRIKVTWKAVDGAERYDIYRCETKTGEYELVKQSTGTSWTDTTAESEKTYYYKVKAIANEVESVYSVVKSGTYKLAQPNVTIGRNTKGKPKLSWKAVNGAVSYKIYRATSKTGTYSLLKNTTSTSYTHTGAVSGKTYYYKVMAIAENTAANSAYSAIDYIKSR